MSFQGLGARPRAAMGTPAWNNASMSRRMVRRLTSKASGRSASVEAPLTGCQSLPVNGLLCKGGRFGILFLSGEKESRPFIRRVSAWRLLGN